MSIKTEYNNYNEDNYIEQNGGLQEITVKITLCEYRNLIEERVYNEKEIEKLQDENKALKSQNDNLCKLFATKNPDMIKNIGEFAKKIFETKVE